jgi:mono/diheme cytochrome c family protein
MKKIILIILIFFFNNNSYADNRMELGLDVFNNKAQCAMCHVLKSAGSTGEIGPNLDMLKPSLAQIIYAVKNGIGVMPAWEGILTTEEIDAVAYYIFSSTNK